MFAIITREILVRKKQNAKNEVVFVKILDVLLVDKKSPKPPLLDCPIPKPPPSDFWRRTKKTKKIHIKI